MKKMSAGGIALIVVGAIFAILLIWGVGSYNSLVGLREGVDNQSSNIQTQLQRRADLIPNLVNTVKGYASHETEIMNEISSSRSALVGSGSMAEKAQADAQLTGALNRLLMIVENYPDLKADQQFSKLMDELSGTENRIAVSRKDYNGAVTSYNKAIKTFPSVILANIFGFSKMDYFEASEGSEQTPPVSFS